MRRVVLVTKGTGISMLIGDFPCMPELGQEIARDPVLHPGTWKVIKVFDEDQTRLLRGLVDVVGEDRLKDLFWVPSDTNVFYDYAPRAAEAA